MRWLVFLAFALLVGCGSTNTPQACKHEALKLLDEGKYQEALNKLNTPECQRAFTKEEYDMNLAAAKLGLIGLDFYTLSRDLLDAQSSNLSTDQFLIKQFRKVSQGKNLKILDEVSKLYGQICKDPKNPKTPIERDACFYKGIVDTALAGASLALLIGDIQGWLNTGNLSCSNDANQNSKVDSAEASACALLYVANASCSFANVSLVQPNLTFNGGYTYDLIRIDVPNSPPCTQPTTHYKLTTNTDVALTSGYCDTNFNPCQNLDINNNCYPCPVITTNGSLTTTQAVADILNNIDQYLTNTNSSTKNSSLQLKQQICGPDNYCTAQDIANYLRR